MPLSCRRGKRQPKGTLRMSQTIDYDAIAQIYAANRSASPAVLGRILEEAAMHTPRFILEVGCGTADYLYALSQAWNITGHGFDQSAGMIAAARQKNPGLILQTGDASRTFPYPGGSFDLVYSVDVIHYIPDLVHFFGQARRLLRPSGRVLTVTDSSDDIRQRTLTEYFPETCPNELQRYPSIECIQQAMQQVGFAHTWLGHSRRDFPIDTERLERYRNKAYSSLRLIPEEAFQRGLTRLSADVAAGKAIGRELYTLVWGETER